MGSCQLPLQKKRFLDGDGRISKERIGDALGAVAGGVFRKGTAQSQFSFRGGTSERRRRAFGHRTAKECVPDDEPLSVLGRSSHGGALSQGRRAFSTGRQ